MDISLGKLQELSMDGEVWYPAVMGSQRAGHNWTTGLTEHHTVSSQRALQRGAEGKWGMKNEWLKDSFLNCCSVCYLIMRHMWLCWSRFPSMKSWWSDWLTLLKDVDVYRACAICSPATPPSTLGFTVSGLSACPCHEASPESNTSFHPQDLGHWCVGHEGKCCWGGHTLSFGQ